MKLSKFIGLIWCLTISLAVLSQKIDYGNNPAAGHYFDVGDCKIYYEVYGKGKTVVLLHGGVYGYIDEFKPFIENLSQNHQVVAIAMRGHGKSEIGQVQYSYNQRAEDAYKVIRNITKDSVAVLGFSEGGYAAMKLAASYPELVSKLIVIGAGDLPKMPKGKNRYEQYTPQMLMKSDSAFFKGRVALMPEPNRWGESLSMLNKMYNEDFVSTETFQKIKSPAMIIAGDKDEYYSPLERFLTSTRAIKNSQLAIIPGCGHVVFYCNFQAVYNYIEPFLKK
jgi:pimeloyl-ACP methyl ester carboxylesterase